MDLPVARHHPATMALVHLQAMEPHLAMDPFQVLAHLQATEPHLTMDPFQVLAHLQVMADPKRACTNLLQATELVNGQRRKRGPMDRQ